MTDPELADIDRDLRERRFVEHTLQIAIQAAIDVGLHIVSDGRLGEPRTNREVFDLLERASVVSPDRAATLRRMVGFRNVLVHGYDDVDLAIVRDIMTNRLDDLTAFASDIRAKFEV
jgi:uncharacterized protein YutE (UPF0331/DUF86 family)